MSTIRVNNLQNTSTTDGGISINASGHVTVDGVAMPSSGPLSNRNLVINGAMQVAQRGTSSTATGVRTVDRFESSWGGGAVTMTQESLTSGSPYNEGFRNYVRLTNTTAATSGTNYRELVYKIEGQDLASSGWNYTSSSSYVTISFWVRSSVSQDYYFYLESRDGSGQIYTFPFTLSADIWTKVTKAIPGGASIQIDNDADLGANFNIVPFYGTTYTDSGNTDETWRARDASSKYMLDMTNTWAGTTDATFDLTGVQVEVGSVATPFEHRSFGDELARCQRYFARSYSYGTATGTASRNGAVLSTAYTQIAYASAGTAFFPVEMRAVPSVTIYSTSTGTAGQVAADANDGVGSAAFMSTKAAFIRRTNNNSGVGANVYIGAHYVAEAEL